LFKSIYCDNNQFLDNCSLLYNCQTPVCLAEGQEKVAKLQK